MCNYLNMYNHNIHFVLAGLNVPIKNSQYTVSLDSLPSFDKLKSDVVSWFIRDNRFLVFK